MSTSALFILAGISGLGMVGCLLDRKWTGFNLFLGIAFVCGLTLYFRLF